MIGPQDNNQDIGIMQKNTLMQAWSDLKDSVFNVLFVILDKNSQDSEQQSLGGLIFQSGLDYLQIMAFPFSALVLQAWNGGNTLTELMYIFERFNVSSYLPNAPFAAFLFVLYTLVFIILLIVIDIIYVSYSFTKKKFKFTFPLVILAQIVPLFVTVLFLPITQTLLIVVQCSANANGVTAMTSFPDVTCWQGWHLFHTSITLIFVTLFVIISSVVAIALFEPRMTTKKLTSRQNSNGQVVFIINKIVLQFFFSFSPFQGSAFYVTIMFFLAFWQFWCYTIKKPYYSNVATKFFRICSTYYFWTTLMLMVGQLLKGYNFDGALIIWISGLPFFAIIIFFLETIKGQNLHLNNLKFKTGQELEAFISLVLELICNRKENKTYDTLLIGYIQRHKELCNEADCPLNNQKKKKNKKESMDTLCVQLLGQIDRMFTAGLKKFPDCTKLRLSYAFFHLEQMQNKKKAYQQFTQTFKLEPSFDQQFNIYRFKKIIKENLEDRDENESDLVETIRFDNHVSLLEEAMIISAKLHKEFWTELKEEKPDLKKLNAVGSQITQTGNAIIQNYKQIVKISSSACEVLYSYAHYLILVNEDYTEGKELLSNARKIFQDKQLENKNQQEQWQHNESLDKRTTPAIIVQYASRSSIPRILTSNLLFTEVSGYMKTELYDKELSLIAPHLFTSNEAHCLSFNNNIKERQCFIRHKFNHLIPATCELLQKEHGNWHVIYKLSSANNNKLVFLVDNVGRITDYNLVALNTFKQAFKITEQFFDKVYMSDIGLKDWRSEYFKKQNGALGLISINQIEKECLVQIEAISGSMSKEYEADDADDQQSEMIADIEKDIGWKVTISRYDRRTQNRISDHELSSNHSVTDNMFDQTVMEIYENPNALDMLISQLAETKHFEEDQSRFVLKEKIKTMRLLNNEIKMVYSYSNENNEYTQMAAIQAEQDDRQIFKFDDENYQAKLRSAINTNLNHEQVGNLRTVSTLFLLCLFGISIAHLQIEISNFGSIDHQMQQTNLRAEQYTRLTANLWAALYNTTNYTNIIDHNHNHSVTFDTTTKVQLVLENNVTEVKSLRDAVILLNSRLVGFFQNPSATNTVILVFNNYFNSIYPAFFRYPTTFEDQSSLSFFFGGGALGITCLMMIYWIYISLKVDKKRYDIMIWFLDIPIPYVTHLGNHCDIYLKQYMTVKELMLKGVPLDEDEDDFEEFSAKRNNPAGNDEEQIQEQMKVRKSLISKNKKETLLSKINLTALKVIWLLFYGLLFSSSVIIMTRPFYTNFSFFKNQWIKTATEITVDNTMYMNLEVANSNLSLSANLPVIFNQLTNEHRGLLSEHTSEQFNLGVYTTSMTASGASYINLYFQDICLVQTLSAVDLLECQTVVGSKLKSGYEAYSKYLITPQPSLSNQIAIANRKYSIPNLVNMLQIWENQLGSSGKNVMNLCSIMLYVFIVCSGLAFLLLWLYYLRKLNTQINQTIQMLNMIPFKLLPKSRKETKMFITWIIKEANKTKHENQ